MGKAIDLTGTKHNMLKILKRKRENRRTLYYCKCDCGVEKWMRADILKNAKSCGCLSKGTEFKSKNIVGNTYGRLTVIESTSKRDINGAVLWKCECTCGKLAYASVSNLKKGAVRSCGCLRTENSKQNIQKAIKIHLKEHIVESTNIQVISRKKLQSNNTSGYTGVTWDESRGKWQAQIRFKNITYNLGRFTNKQDSIAARKEAEEKLHDDFLKWYFSQKES